jgi:hypothetical protein
MPYNTYTVEEGTYSEEGTVLSEKDFDSNKLIFPVHISLYQDFPNGVYDITVCRTKTNENLSI